MRIAIIGTGYVGLVTGADFACRGIDVVCVDIDAARIENLVRGVMPFYEPGLPERVAEGVAAHRLEFTTDIAQAMTDADIVLSAVGTPAGEDGRADCSAVFAVADAFALHAKDGTLLVNKSTVPVGTGERIQKKLKLQSKKFSVVANPEFLSQGTAVNDTAHPTRIVIGTENEEARERMRSLYASFIADGVPYCEMATRSAEAVKCAANAFLATKISFINEIANYCELVGADVGEVAKAIGLDPRIGPQFLRAGLGYGGGCLPKDVRALIASGDEAGYRFRLLPEVERVNDAQRFALLDRYRREVGPLAGRRVAVWGLAFKPGTDDLRGAPSLAIVAQLEAEGADVVAFDPVAAVRARVVLPSLVLADDAASALTNADALLVLTEWPEFSAFDLAQLSSRMRHPVVLDGRGVFFGRAIPENVRYFAIGCG